MQQFQWLPEFETGIEVVDAQHMRIFEYLLEVDRAIRLEETDSIQHVVRSLIDYSISHNAFEETLMEQAEYPILAAHAKVHEAFRNRALAYEKRIEQGEDCIKVAKEVRSDIGLWLTNHIQRDDKDYVPYVRKSMEGGFVSRMMKRFFA